MTRPIILTTRIKLKLFIISNLRVKGKFSPFFPTNYFRIAFPYLMDPLFQIFSSLFQKWNFDLTPTHSCTLPPTCFQPIVASTSSLLVSMHVFLTNVGPITCILLSKSSFPVGYRPNTFLSGYLQLSLCHFCSR